MPYLRRKNDFLTGSIPCAQETHGPVKRSKKEKEKEKKAHATAEEAHATAEVAHATPEVAAATAEEAHATPEVAEAAAETSQASWMAELKDVKTAMEKILRAQAVLESKVEALGSSNEVSELAATSYVIFHVLYGH